MYKSELSLLGSVWKNRIIIQQTPPSQNSGQLANSELHLPQSLERIANSGLPLGSKLWKRNESKWIFKEYMTWFIFVHNNCSQVFYKGSLSHSSSKAVQ